MLEDNVLNSTDDFLLLETEKLEPKTEVEVELKESICPTTTPVSDISSPKPIETLPDESSEIPLPSPDTITTETKTNPPSPPLISTPLLLPTTTISAVTPTIPLPTESTTSTSSPTPTNISSFRTPCSSISRTPSPTYSNPTSGVSSTSYQLDLDRPDQFDNLLNLDQHETKSADSISQEFGLKIPVADVDSSLLVFASKSKPKVVKQTVSYL